MHNTHAAAASDPDSDSDKDAVDPACCAIDFFAMNFTTSTTRPVTNTLTPRYRKAVEYDIDLNRKPINIAPTLEDKVDICQNAIDLAVSLGVDQPKVAILAAVETVTSKMPATIDAAALCKMAERGQITGGILDGPLAFDNAISPEAAAIKGIKSEVAGRAQILVVPDLEAGNMLAKNLAFLAKADTAGIVLGARVPIILTSRADSVRSRMASCAVAVLYADARRKSSRLPAA